MKRLLALYVVTLCAHCTQSSQVFAPVNNVATTGTTTPPTYTLTLNVVTANANHQNKAYSALLFRNGTLYAAQYNAGALTDGSGAATLVINGVDTGTGCPTATPAALEAGTYTLYFAIQYGAETVTVANPANGSCGGNGWINSSSGGNLYGTMATLNIAADATYTINSTNLALFRQHTFDLQAGAGSYSCAVTDMSVSAYSTAMQPLAVYSRSGNGTTTGNGVVTYLLPSGTFRYFCTLGASSSTGNLTVTGATTTALGTTDFTP
ncbi:MAG: hypothetical protein ACOY5B_10075 [Spirochaetota bacterium]